MAQAAGGSGIPVRGHPIRNFVPSAPQCPSNEIKVRTGTSMARQLGGAARVPEVDNKHAREHFRAHLPNSFTAPSAVPPVAIRSSQDDALAF